MNGIESGALAGEPERWGGAELAPWAEALAEVVGQIQLVSPGTATYRACCAMALHGRHLAHGVELAPRPSRWLALEDGAGGVAACAGLWTETLPSLVFREGPAERARGRRVELGAWTAVAPGVIGRLLRGAPFVLAGLGVKDVLVLATERERWALEAASWALEGATAARLERVPAEAQAAWGRYFEAAPQTAWCSVPDLVAAQVAWLERTLGVVLGPLAGADR